MIKSAAYHARALRGAIETAAVPRGNFESAVLAGVLAMLTERGRDPVEAFRREIK